MSGEVSVMPIISYNHVLSVFGPGQALVKYEALVENLRELSFSTENVSSMGGLITAVVELRRAIIKQNEQQILPIPVLRICVLSVGERPITSDSIQSTSHHYMPIFLSSSVDKYPICDKYTIRECVLEGRKGHYIIDSSGATKASVGGRITYLSVGYVCCTREDHTSSFSKMNGVTACSYVDGMTLVYGSNEQIFSKVMKVSREYNVPCAIHACSDFTIRAKDTYAGNGVRCVTELVAMSYSECVYVTEAASYYVPGFEKKDYTMMNIRTIGCVYLRNEI